MSNHTPKSWTTTQHMLVRSWNALGSDRWRVLNIGIAASAALFGLADLVYDFGSNGADFTWASALAILVASAALPIGQARPIAVLGLVSIARLVVAADAGTEIALSLQGAVALYAVARTRSRTMTGAATCLSALVAVAAIVIVSPDAIFEEGIAEVAIILLVLAVAEVARTNEARTNERVAAATSERVQAERLRIARDLHDVVAHSLSNIAVQSGVASRLIDTNPQHAKKALDIINDAGRTSLDELRVLLGLLRSEDDLLDTEPTPGQPSDIDEVIKRNQSTGLAINVVHHGELPPNSSPGVVLAACRILQESLTNVARHAGPVAVLIELDHTDDDLRLRVTNEPGAPNRPTAPSTGVGIIGMTERAETIGGHLTTRALDQGGFVVEATLPHHNENQS